MVVNICRKPIGSVSIKYCGGRHSPPVSAKLQDVTALHRFNGDYLNINSSCSV